MDVPHFKTTELIERAARSPVHGTAIEEPIFPPGAAAVGEAGSRRASSADATAAGRFGWPIRRA